MHLLSLKFGAFYTVEGIWQSNTRRYHAGSMKWLLQIKTGVESVAVAVFVCCDSDYNLYAMCCKRRTPNRRQKGA